MEYCGAGSVSDIMKLRNKTVSIGGHKNMRLRRLPMYSSMRDVRWTSRYCVDYPTQPHDQNKTKIDQAF
jgi:hypothetical protein